MTGRLKYSERTNLKVRETLDDVGETDHLQTVSLKVMKKKSLRVHYTVSTKMVSKLIRNDKGRR